MAWLPGLTQGLRLSSSNNVGQIKTKTRKGKKNVSVLVTVRLPKTKTMWMRLAPTSLRFGMRLNNEYSKAHAKGQLPNLSLTLRNLYLKFAALVQSSTPPTIFWNGRFRSYPQWMRNGPCSSSIESPRVKVHVDMPNFAIGHYDPSILSAKDDASYSH